MATDDETARLVDPKAFVRTYNPPSYADAWDVIEDYRRVMEFSSKHPNLGSSAVSTRINLPRSRIRPWMDGAKPDALRGLETARDRGWVYVAADSDVFRGLNVFCSWIFSGGSIQTETSVPYFAIRDDRDVDILREAAGLANVEVDYSREAEAGRADEFRPSADASVLGRVLQVLGAPSGGKNPERPLQVPRYLDSAPQWPRREFVQVYLNNRGQKHEWKATLTLREERSSGYLQSLATLIESLTDERVNVSGKNIVISADGARTLEEWPPLLGLARD